MFEREFIERRAQERRERVNAAIAHHFAECERRTAQRRSIDRAKVNAWCARFDELKKDCI